MKPAKNTTTRKHKPRPDLTHRPPAPDTTDHQEEIGLAKAVRLLEQDVARLSHINLLYKQQLEELEADNLSLYSRLQGLKAEHEAVLGSRLSELDRAALHNQELTRIIHLL